VSDGQAFGSARRVIDGFTIGQRIHSAGMTTLLSVTHPGITAPLLSF
jgi:hypothetical protein